MSGRTLMQDQYRVDNPTVDPEQIILQTQASAQSEQDKDASLDWNEIFDRLDSKDGQEDQRIPKTAIFEWVDTLDFQASVSLETRHGISRAKVMYLLNAADIDKDGYINRDEFKGLVERYSRELEKIQRSTFLTYIRVAAYAEEYRWWPPPCFMLLVTGFQIGLHIYSQYSPVINWWLFLAPKRRYEVWRWLTYSFIHADHVHITVNLFLQNLVGIPLEMTSKSWRVGLVYFLGVLFGSLLFSVTNPTVGLLGASAGVTAIVTAHISSLVLNWKEDTLILRQRIREKQASSPLFGRIVRVARIALVLGILSVDVINMIYAKENDRTGYGAHGGGAIAGILVGILLLENRRVQFWEVWAKGICLGVAVAFAVSLIIYNIVAPEGVYPVQDFSPLQTNRSFFG